MAACFGLGSRHSLDRLLSGFVDATAGLGPAVVDKCGCCVRLLVAADTGLPAICAGLAAGVAAGVVVPSGIAAKELDGRPTLWSGRTEAAAPESKVSEEEAPTPARRTVFVIVPTHGMPDKR